MSTQRKKVRGDDPLVFEGQVMDNVHGFISYTKAEKDIMDTQLFKRLQSLKQLSVVNWVFPGSEHTRYVHSLGVMHIADKMAISMKLTNWERRLLRMAGLLHDIGHYPLSHVGESPYRSPFDRSTMRLTDTQQFLDAINGEVYERIRDDQIRVKTNLMRPSRYHHHEAVGGEIVKNNKKICQIVEKELGPGAADIIADIITGNVDREGTDPLWVQIMHSELDADGIDYIMRDSMFAGTSFGSGEIEQLIRCLTVGVDPESGARIMCVKPKGIPAADQYLINKFFHYTQVVFNRHIAISEWMARVVIGWMRDNPSVFQEKWMFPRKDEMDDWLKKGGPDAYLKFTDNQFWTAVEELRSSRKAPAHIKRFCKYLIDHEEPKLAKPEEIRIVSRNDKTIRDRLKMSDTWEKKGKCGKWITVLESRTMTSQMREEDFQAYLTAYRKKHAADPDADGQQKSEFTPEEVEDFISKAKVKRLMECICVKERNGDIKVLCDHEQSLMQDMYNETVAILRSYAYSDT